MTEDALDAHKFREARKMGSGPRVSAANREEVARLREQLSKCTANQVSKAQCIYDNICALCNYSKQSYPRACRTCGYYGHSHHHCPVHKARLEYQASLAQDDVCEQECTPAQWRTVQRIRLLFEAGEEAGKLGYQCEREFSYEGACAVCKGCKAWEQYVRTRVEEGARAAACS